MAALNDGEFRIFTSKLHTFLVGENKKAIVVHAEVIAKQSHGLDVLINGEMAEASNGQTKFDDVHEDTFIRFCQFAYIGDYETPAFIYHSNTDDSNTSSPRTLSRSSLVVGEASVPATEPVEDVATEVRAAADPGWAFDEPAPVAAVAEVEDDGWSFQPVKPKKSKKSLSNSRVLRQQFDRKMYDITTTESITKARCGIRENELSGEDYTPVFLGHARLYVFAEKWGIDMLKTLTLYKLHKTLVAFKIYEARCGDVAELVKFTYSNENTPDLEDDVDALRALVVHYVTCELESLIEAPEFLALLEQPGLFSRDLVRMMMKRID